VPPGPRHLARARVIATSICCRTRQPGHLPGPEPDGPPAPRRPAGTAGTAGRRPGRERPGRPRRAGPARAEPGRAGEHHRPAGHLPGLSDTQGSRRFGLLDASSVRNLIAAAAGLAHPLVRDGPAPRRDRRRPRLRPRPAPRTPGPEPPGPSPPAPHPEHYQGRQPRYHGRHQRRPGAAAPPGPPGTQQARDYLRSLRVTLTRSPAAL